MRVGVYVALGGWVRGSFISLCLVGSVVVMDVMDMMDGGCCVVLVVYVARVGGGGGGVL